MGRESNAIRMMVLRVDHLRYWRQMQINAITGQTRRAAKEFAKQRKKANNPQG